MKSHRMQSLRATFAVALFAVPSSMAQGLDATPEATATPAEMPAEEPAAEPAAAPAPEAPVAAAASDGGDNAGYDKGFFIKSDDGSFALHTEARVQGRFVFESADVAPGDDTVDARAEEASFRVQRARLTLGGHAFSEAIKYKFQSEFGRGEVILKDFYLDYVMGDVVIRTGQYKRPFSRQQLTSSGRLELVDRSITNNAFVAGRDIGIMAHNNFEKSPELEWAVGVFNGQLADEDIGTNYPALFGPTIVGRVGINRGGISGYSEADLEGGPFRFGAALGVLAHLDVDDDDGAGPDADTGTLMAQVDFIAKAEGLSATGGIYMASVQDGEGFFDQSQALLGFHAQAGYMLAKEHQVAGRFAVVNENDITGLADDVNEMELRVGYSLYTFKHGFKWQTDLGLLTVDGNSLTDVIEARSQIQLSF